MDIKYDNEAVNMSDESELVHDARVRGREYSGGHDGRLEAPQGPVRSNFHEIECTSSEDEKDNLIKHFADERRDQVVDEERDNTAHQSLMNLIKGNIGTGILALPVAFKYGGLWVGFVGVLGMAVIAVHCIHQLLKCNTILCRRTGRSQMDYGDVVEMAFQTGPPKLRRFAPAAKITMNIFLLITQLGFCTVYINFVAQNIQQVIQYYGHFIWDVRLFDFFVYVLLIPYVCIRNLKTLALFSLIANIFMLIGLFITLQYCFFDLPSVNDRPAFGGWQSLPLFFGIAIYAFEGIGVVMPIENKMRVPEELRGWNGVVNTGLVIVACLYAGVGFFGYLKFGDKVVGSITINLPQSPWYYMVVKLIFAAAIFFSYGLQFYVPIDILWPILDRRYATSSPHHYQLWIKHYGEYLLRFVLVTLTFVLAIAVPQLDLMISLIGALSSSAVAIIIPPLVEIVTLIPEGTLKWPIVVKNVFIMVFGFVGFVVGTVTTLIQIVKAFQGKVV